MFLSKFKKVKEIIMDKVLKINLVKNSVLVVVSGCISSMFISNPVFAAGESYTGPVEKLKNVGIAVAGAAGVIVVLYGVVKFAESFQKKDQNGEYSAVYTIVAGGILVGASAVLTALGV